MSESRRDGYAKVIAIRESENSDHPIAARGGSLLRAAMVFISSVALGGLAFAIWNRKSLDSMRTTKPVDDAK